MSQLDQMDPAVFYDATLRFTIPSGKDPHATYMIELDSFGGNGSCSCEDFTMRKGPLLARRVTPADAVAQKLVKLPKSGRVSDALRCKHLVDARDQLASSVVRALVKAEKLNRGPR